MLTKFKSGHISHICWWILVLLLKSPSKYESSTNGRELEYQDVFVH